MTRKKGPLCLSYFVICIRCATIWIFRKLFCGYGNALKSQYKNDPIDRILTLVSFTSFMLPSGFASILMVVLLVLVSVWRSSSSLVLCCNQMFATNGILPLQGRTETCFSKTLYLLLYTYCYVRTFLIVTDLYVRCIRSYVGKKWAPILKEAISKNFLLKGSVAGRRAAQGNDDASQIIR